MGLFEGRIGDGERRLVFDIANIGDADDAAKFVGGEIADGARSALAWLSLRKRRRTRRMESYLAFDLLHDLMDVAIQDRDRSEALEQLERFLGVLSAPTPFLVNRPQWDVREEYDRC